MLFGHVEKPEHIVDHIIRIRELHKNTNGFTTFIPLKFSLENTELEKTHMIQRESPSTYDLRVIAVSRILLSKCTEQYFCILDSPWKEVSQVALRYGGNDLVGTAFSEEIFKATGKNNVTSTEELVNLIGEINRQPAQRDTFFNILKRF